MLFSWRVLVILEFFPPYASSKHVAGVAGALFIVPSQLPPGRKNRCKSAPYQWINVCSWKSTLPFTAQHFPLLPKTDIQEINDCISGSLCIFWPYTLIWLNVLSKLAFSHWINEIRVFNYTLTAGHLCTLSLMILMLPKGNFGPSRFNGDHVRPWGFHSSL